MDIAYLILSAQLIAVSIGFISSIVFLIMYKQTWDFSNEFSRFIISLNVFFILLVITFITQNFIKYYLVVDVIRAILMLGLSLTMLSQIVLFRQAHREDSNNGRG